MTSRLLTTDILRQVNTASRRARLNHVLTPGVLEKLDEEGTHVANHEMFHGDGDGACIRTIILVKLQGRQEPYTTTLDMTIKDWNSLVTADAYLQATTERMS